MVNTTFGTIYDCFLGKITDDMYVELTPEDTLRDLQSLLINALPGFEFPRCNLFDYTLHRFIKKRKDAEENGCCCFIVGIWHELDAELLNPDDFENLDDMTDFDPEEEYVLVDNSSFNFELTPEEINIIAILMMCNWVQRQVTSIENTRMKYSGSDFKMTSQANHLQKLITLLNECQRQSHHMQRLYKRRRIIKNTGTSLDGLYRSNWDVFGQGVYYDRYKN